MATTLPDLVTKLCYGASAWIVGGAAREDNPKDYDVCVPFSEWARAQHMIPRDARVNSFGGWKCVSEGKIVDVWPGDLGQLMTNGMVTDLWHPQTGVRFQKSPESYRYGPKPVTAIEILRAIAKKPFTTQTIQVENDLISTAAIPIKKYGGVLTDDNISRLKQKREEQLFGDLPPNIPTQIS